MTDLTIEQILSKLFLAEITVTEAHQMILGIINDQCKSNCPVVSVENGQAVEL